MALIKGLRFFIALTFLCAIGILLTSYPGEVTIGWFGYSISLPIGLFLTCLIVTFAFFTSLYGIWKWLWSLPNNYFTHLKSKRIKKGNNLLIDGLSAIAAGQNHEAKEVIGIACELLPDDPLTQFIAAQAANMTGDDESATKHYMSMQKDRRTSFLGLRGLKLFKSTSIKLLLFGQTHLGCSKNIYQIQFSLHKEVFFQKLRKIKQLSTFPKQIGHVTKRC